MDIHDALSKVEVYNTFTILPYASACGLIHRAKQHEDVFIRRMLESGREFCRNFLMYFSDKKQAERTDVHLVMGMERIFPGEPAKYHGWRNSISKVLGIVDNVLNSNPVEDSEAKEAISTLEKLADKAKSILYKEDAEAVLAGPLLPESYLHP